MVNSVFQNRKSWWWLLPTAAELIEPVARTVPEVAEVEVEAPKGYLLIYLPWPVEDTFLQTLTVLELGWWRR